MVVKIINPFRLINFTISLTEYGSEDNYVVSSDSMNDGDIHKTCC